MMRIVGVFLLVLIAFSACKNASSEQAPVSRASIKEVEVPTEIKNESLPVIDYLKWMQDPQNGFHKIKAMDELEFSIQYKTPEYMICNEERKEELSDTLVKRRSENFEELLYFDLKIRLTKDEGELLKHNLASKADYEKRTKYYAFEMQQDIQLVDGKDTLPCVIYHFERTYDVAPFCTLLLGFSKNEKTLNQAKTVLVYDKIFNKGLLKFTFKENKLQTLPKLQTI